VSYLIGIDVGTTDIKVAVYDVDQRVRTVHTCPTRTHYPRPGWAEYDADELWADIAGLLHQAVGQLPGKKIIKSIAVASMGEAGLLVDASGKALTPVIAWFDCRTEDQSRWWEENAGQDEVYAITGHPIHSMFGVAKLMWLREHAPDAYGQASHWLSVEDLVLFRLSGSRATDYSVASRTMAFDIGQREWSSQLLDKAEIDQALMPPAFPGGTPVGQVTPKAAGEAGLASGTPVCTGGHDHICASFAVGAFQPGSLLDSTGTSESLVLTIPRVLRSQEMQRLKLPQECHVVGDRYAVLAGFPVAAYAQEWLNRVLEHGEIAPDYGLTEAARVAPGAEGLFFLPHLRGSGSPTFDPLCRGAFVGLTAAHGRQHLLRAAIEGVCYELKQVLKVLESASSYRLEEIYTTGKVIQSELWLQTKADITGKRLRVPRLSEAAALGAALLGGIGVGLYGSPKEAVASLAAESLVVEPQRELVAFYQAQYDSFYSQIYPALRDLYHSTGDDWG
jgi:xylulokinase